MTANINLPATTTVTKSFPLLTQNSDLRRTGVFAWTIPAHITTLDDGRHVTTCPSAGVCAAACYATMGRWKFKNVRAAHNRKLQWVLDDLAGWEAAMTNELLRKKYRGGRFIRVHDAGDFFSEDYARAWFRIAHQHPDVTFYAYTKQVALVKGLSDLRPANFVVIFSVGGKQDHLVDRDTDRHCDVFPSREALDAAGYFDQGDDDRLAATAPTNRIGIVVNRLPVARRRMGGRAFSDWQSDVSSGRIISGGDKSKSD